MDDGIKHGHIHPAPKFTTIKLREARHSAMDWRNPVPWMASFGGKVDPGYKHYLIL